METQAIFERVRAQVGDWITGGNLEAIDPWVEVAAEGAAEALNRLLEHLHRGPFMARVDKIDVEWQDEGGRFLSFEVRF